MLFLLIPGNHLKCVVKIRSVTAETRLISIESQPQKICFAIVDGGGVVGVVVAILGLVLVVLGPVIVIVLFVISFLSQKYNFRVWSKSGK